jgi:hypothetical protein
MSGSQSAAELCKVLAGELARLDWNEWALLAVCIAPLCSLILAPLSFKRLEAQSVEQGEDGAAAPGPSEVAIELRQLSEQMFRLQRTQEQALQGVQVDMLNLSHEVHGLGDELADLQLAKQKTAPDASRSRSSAPSVDAPRDGTLHARSLDDERGI